MTLATMSNNILRFCPGLNLDLIKSTIQDSYRQLCLKEWSRLSLTRQISTAAPYSTGTVSVAATGIVTGVGTTFTLPMVGRYMRVYYADSFFEIATYTSPVQITLKDWPGDIITGKAYSIFKTIYPVDASFGQVWEVIHQIPLKKKSSAYFNKIDPSRTNTTSSPTSWAYAGMVSGVIQVEIYPVPSVVVPLRVEGKVGFSTLIDAETAKLPEDLLESHALLSCYRLKDLKEPKQGWAEKMVVQVEFLNGLMADYEDADFQQGDFSDRVKDTMGKVGYPTDDNFALSHDVD